jgi:hypothetical protein
MFTRILATTVLLAGLTQGALAESAIPAPQSPPASSAQTKQSIPQELRQKLSSAGFTDVEMVPSSFLVSAKNKEGNHVMMRISQESMTMLTEIPVSETSTTGSSTSSGESSAITPESSTSKPTPGSSTNN